MSFWSSIWGGSNPTLNKDMANFGQIGGFATGLGEQNLTQASNFWSSILSGDPSKTAKTLAPQISAIQQQGQQERSGLAQFGNRAGGTNAASQMIGDKSQASVNDMIAKLMGGAAGELGSMGGNLLGTGMQAYGQQLAASQQQMRNWSQSILGHAMISGVQTAEEAGELYATRSQSTQASSDYSSGPG